MRQAAEIANEARKQVIKALTQARNAWHALAHEYEHAEAQRAAIGRGRASHRDRHAEARERQQQVRDRRKALRDIQAKRKP